MTVCGFAAPRATPRHYLTRDYLRGRYRITLSAPRKAYESANSAAQAWFAGMNRYPATGEILLRINTAADSLGAGTGLHIISTDGGWSFDPATAYTVSGSHTSGEPLTLSGSSYVGGYFAPAAWAFGTGGTDKRTLIGPSTTISNGGRNTVYTNGAITISGFPADLGYYDQPHGIVGFGWFGDIVQLASNNWVSCAPVIVGSNTKVTNYCIKSINQGAAWTVIGTIADQIVDEGMDEPALFQGFDGKLYCISRVGITRMAMASSADSGVTWSAATRLSPWCKAARVMKLSNNNDYALTTGYVTRATEWPGGASPVDGSVPDLAFAPATLGLFVTDDATKTTWPVVDIADHHDLFVDPSYQFNGGIYTPNPSLNPAGTDYATGYTSMVELEAGHLLISYDSASGAYGMTSRPNRVWIMDAWIRRES